MRIGLLSAQSEEKILFYERLTHYCFFRHPHSISPLTVVLRRGDDVLMNRTDYTHTNSHSMLEQTDRAVPKGGRLYSVLLTEMSSMYWLSCCSGSQYCTHFITFIWASYWPSSTATRAVWENGFINNDVTQYHKKRLFSKLAGNLI